MSVVLGILVVIGVFMHFFPIRSMVRWLNRNVTLGEIYHNLDIIYSEQYDGIRFASDSADPMHYRPMIISPVLFSGACYGCMCHVSGLFPKGYALYTCQTVKFLDAHMDYADTWYNVYKISGLFENIVKTWFEQKKRYTLFAYRPSPSYDSNNPEFKAEVYGYDRDNIDSGQRVP